MAGRRVAVTGIGILSSCGNGIEAFWEGLNAAPPEGERRVRDFDPASVFDNPKEARRADRVTHTFMVPTMRKSLSFMHQTVTWGKLSPNVRKTMRKSSGDME